jgi:hypothetical protein
MTIEARGLVGVSPKEITDWTFVERSICFAYRSIAGITWSSIKRSSGSRSRAGSDRILLRTATVSRTTAGQVVSTAAPSAFSISTIQPLLR